MGWFSKLTDTVKGTVDPRDWSIGGHELLSPDNALMKYNPLTASYAALKNQGTTYGKVYDAGALLALAAAGGAAFGGVGAGGAGLGTSEMAGSGAIFPAAEGSTYAGMLEGGGGAAAGAGGGGGIMSMFGTPGGFAAGMMGVNSLFGMYQAQQQKKMAEAAMSKMDPFGPYRKQYADQLAQLSADPSTLQNLPGYKAGLQAVERKMAAGGYLGSGNETAALFDYGGTIYNQEASRLAGLAGANIGPSAVPYDIAMSGTNLMGQSMSNLAYLPLMYSATNRMAGVQ